jgi:hypothetical protein
LCYATVDKAELFVTAKEGGAMRRNWLRGMLLGVSLALLVGGAVALAQRPRVDAGCGTAKIDGLKSPGEWDAATPVQMYVEWLGEGDPPGTMYLMNDEDWFYLGVYHHLQGASIDPACGGADLLCDVHIEDEPVVGDGQWAAPDCDPAPSEGLYQAYKGHGPLHFRPFAQVGICPEIADPPGVEWDASFGSAFFEWAFHLTDSELDAVGPDECFTMRVYCEAAGTEAGCITDHGVGSEWPDLEYLQRDPVGFGKVCLSPCEEEFVPEPGTILLLGSGLAGLAGYAGLRWRTRD